MGIDLYAGPLPRYLMLDWETPAAKFSREHGIAYEIVHQASPKTFSRQEADAFTRSFRGRLAEKLGEMPDWQTDPAAPYEAWQLREGLDAIVLAAAHRHRPELTLPVELPANVQLHPAVSQASAQNYYIGPMAVFEAHIIVPGVEPRICGDHNHNDSPVIVVTTAALADSVDAMMEFFDLDAAGLSEILAEGPPIVGPVKVVSPEGKWSGSDDSPPANPVYAHATRGLACFAAALNFANATGVMIIRDE